MSERARFVACVVSPFDGGLGTRLSLNAGSARPAACVLKSASINIIMPRRIFYCIVQRKKLPTPHVEREREREVFARPV